MRLRFSPWVGTIPWRRKWQPTPVFLLEKFHGQRSLAGYSPWGHKELDTSEQMNAHTRARTHTHTQSQHFFHEILSEWNPFRKSKVTLAFTILAQHYQHYTVHKHFIFCLRTWGLFLLMSNTELNAIISFILHLKYFIAHPQG